MSNKSMIVLSFPLSLSISLCFHSRMQAEYPFWVVHFLCPSFGQNHPLMARFSYAGHLFNQSNAQLVYERVAEKTGVTKGKRAGDSAQRRDMESGQRRRNAQFAHEKNRMGSREEIANHWRFEYLVRSSSRSRCGMEVTNSLQDFESPNKSR